MLKRILLHAALAATLAAGCAQAAGLAEARYTQLAMGTVVSARIYARNEEAASRLVDLFEDKVAAYETLFTVHAEGPLAEVNKRAGSWVGLDCRVAGLVEQAKTLAKESGRAFEPTIGPVVNVWKIGFGGEGVPERKAIEEALKKVDYSAVETDLTPGKCRVKIAQGQSLDLGAIAKGWIGTALVNDLKEAGATNALIDLGGNVAALSGNPSGEDWRVGVQLPGSERGTIYAVIAMHDESVITSGAYERKIEKDGKTYGHILSASTGMPVATDVASITIVNADGAFADGWCTAVFAMGVEKCVERMKKDTGFQALVLDTSLKKAWISEELSKRTQIIDPSIEVKVVQAPVR